MNDACMYFSDFIKKGKKESLTLPSMPRKKDPGF